MMILDYVLRPTAALKRYAMKMLVLFLTASFLMSWGSLFYILFYNLVIPDISFTTALNFVFRECNNKRCEHPSAFVNLKNPNFDFNFKRGEQYDFIVDLLVPDSPVNHDVGMFVLSMELNGENYSSQRRKTETLHKKEQRSTMLRYKSPLVRLLTSLAYSPFLVYGLTEETQRISTVVATYEETPEFTLKNINIVLESYRLNVYEGHLTILVKLEGLRYFMYHYPLVSFMIGYPVFLVPVVVIFFSVTSNTFENKKRRLTEFITRTLLNADFRFEEAEADSKCKESIEDENEGTCKKSKVEKEGTCKKSIEDENEGTCKKSIEDENEGTCKKSIDENEGNPEDKTQTVSDSDEKDKIVTLDGFTPQEIQHEVVAECKGNKKFEEKHEEKTEIKTELEEKQLEEYQPELDLLTLNTQKSEDDDCQSISDCSSAESIHLHSNSSDELI